MDRTVYRFPEKVPVYLRIFNHVFQVDRTKVAGLIGQERLLAAGVGGFDFPEHRSRLVSVDGIDEHHAGITVFPRQIGNQIENFTCPERTDDFFSSRIDQLIVAVCLYGSHEVVGYGN